MHPGLVGLVVLLSASALVGAVLLSRHDRAGTGFLLGAGLGPVGVVVIRLRREAWEARWHRHGAGAEEARKEQALRDWRGY